MLKNVRTNIYNITRHYLARLPITTFAIQRTKGKLYFPFAFLCRKMCPPFKAIFVSLFSFLAVQVVRKWNEVRQRRCSFVWPFWFNLKECTLGKRDDFYTVFTNESLFLWNRTFALCLQTQVWFYRTKLSFVNPLEPSIYGRIT